MARIDKLIARIVPASSIEGLIALIKIPNFAIKMLAAGPIAKYVKKNPSGDWSAEGLAALLVDINPRIHRTGVTLLGGVRFSPQQTARLWSRCALAASTLRWSEPTLAAWRLHRTAAPRE